VCFLCLFWLFFVFCVYGFVFVPFCFAFVRIPPSSRVLLTNYAGIRPKVVLTRTEIGDLLGVIQLKDLRCLLFLCVCFVQCVCVCVCVACACVCVCAGLFVLL